MTTQTATIRNKTEIQTELSQARRAYDNYNNVQNEGYDCPDRAYLNPHFETIQTLANELHEVEQTETADKLSGESLKTEQAWFNAQGFTRPDLAQKACRARGYNMSDLTSAVKAAK